MSDQTKLEPCPGCGRRDRVKLCCIGVTVFPPTPDQQRIAELEAEITRLRAPVAVDAVPESKLVSSERPEGIPNLPSPGWHEAIEKAPVFAFLLGEGTLEGYWFGDHRPSGKRHSENFWWRKHLRASLLPPGGEGLKK